MKVFYLIFILFFQKNYSQSLWVDKNPYAPSQDIQIGTPITIVFRKGLKFDFNLESKKDDNYTIKANPDKSFVDNLKPYSSDQSIVKNQKASVKSNFNFDGKVTALVTENDKNLKILKFKGSINRRVNDQTQNLSIEGVVSSKKIEPDLTVDVSLVADLHFIFNSQIIPKNLNQNLQLQDNNQNSDEENPTNSQENNNVNLSEKDKQELLLKYMKRMLGESE